MSRVVFALLFAALSSSAWSQAYPAKPVRIVVPFAVGGSADVYARFIGAKLTENLGQTFVVENRPGGGAVIGTDLVAKSPADGYTILMMSNTHTVNETLIAKKPYDLMRDLAPITGVNYQDLLLVVNAEVKASNLREFIALAKAQPGKLNYASSGPGTPYHMAGELFKHMAGVNIVHTRGGKLKALATTGKTRSAVTPDVPTAAEAGVPGYEATIWLGLMAPAGTPRPVLEKLNAEVIKVINAPEVKENWTKQGAVPMGMPVDEFGKFLRDDVQKWAKLVKDTGMKVD
jgi:tripartite-type tricarboxylate transporter receptor subunit TctC